MVDSSSESLLRRIWITRKCRINASERLANFDSKCQFLLAYYPTILVAISIKVFYLEKTNQIKSIDEISTLLLIFSIALTILSVFFTSKNYKERSVQLKYNYIAIGNLLFDLEKLIEKQKICDELNNIYESLKAIEEKYQLLLENVENHSTYDWYKVMLSDEVEQNKLKRLEIADYLFYKLRILILWGVLFLGPIPFLLQYVLK